MKFPTLPIPKMTAGAAVYPYSPKLEKAFTLVSRYEEVYTLFKKLGGHSILLPRAICPVSDDDRRITGPSIDFPSHFKPRNQEQARIVKEATALLKQGESFITQSPTGSGKTVMSAEIIGRVGVKTLVIVPKEDIIIQWRSALKMILGLHDSEIGLIQGDVCDVKNKKVVIGMIHSLGKKDRYPKWVYKEFGFVIWDEVHVVGAETFSETAWIFPAKLRMGLSATPYRKDGKDTVFHAHIGPVKVKGHAIPLRPKVILQPTNWKLPIVNQRNEMTGQWEKGPMRLQAGRTMKANKMLAGDPERNNLIAEFVWKAYQKGRNIIVFSDLKDYHLDRIYAMLVKKGVPKKDIAYYVGGMKEKEREAAKVKRVLLSTYQMTAMATDIPWLDTCVLGTPRSDVVQIIGRILREYEGKISHHESDEKEGTVPVVYDLVDVAAPLFRAYKDKRMEYYFHVKADIIRL